MPIQLDKILADIAEEKTLHPNYPNPAKKQTDDAWLRVGKKNKLSVHECRSIFKVLQKKYEQERVKDSSAWKLFNVMDEIHKKVDIKTEVKHEVEQETPMEDDEEYEMLEVQEEEDHSAAAMASQFAAASCAPNAGSGSPTQESPNKSMKSNSSTGSPERDEKPLLRNLTGTGAQKTPASSTAHVEERKILNSLPNASHKNAVGSTTTTPSAVAAATLQKKGITMKKTVPTTPTAISKITTGSISAQNNNKTPVRGGNCTLLEVGKTIQLPESIKRKLSEDHATHSPHKRSNLSQAAVAAAATAAQQQQQQANSGNNTSPSQLTTIQTAVKQERESETLAAQTQSTHGINLITIPANPTRNDLTNGVGAGGSLIVGAGSAGPTSSTAATVASTSTNGYSPRLEEIDFRNDIIFDAGNGHGINGGAQQQAVNRVNHHRTSEIINLGNFDQSLPPTFFKNLCNSSRHEALGLYVANVMNRLGSRSAAKLELGILRAIIDVQSDELEQ